MSVHQEGPDCLGCNDKLAQAHPYLCEWYLTDIKPNFPDVHISWAYRGQADQERAYSAGTTRLHFPKSAHNQMQDGEPCALALDLFQIKGSKAIFDPTFYHAVHCRAQEQKRPILWGAVWRQLGDNDHFQYKPVPSDTTPAS